MTANPWSPAIIVDYERKMIGDLPLGIAKGFRFFLGLDANFLRLTKREGKEISKECPSSGGGGNCIRVPLFASRYVA
jgi:hypothetical protein